MCGNYSRAETIWGNTVVIERHPIVNERIISIIPASKSSDKETYRKVDLEVTYIQQIVVKH